MLKTKREKARMNKSLTKKERHPKRELKTLKARRETLRMMMTMMILIAKMAMTMIIWMMTNDL